MQRLVSTPRCPRARCAESRTRRPWFKLGVDSVRASRQCAEASAVETADLDADAFAESDFASPSGCPPFSLHARRTRPNCESESTRQQTWEPRQWAALAPGVCRAGAGQPRTSSACLGNVGSHRRSLPTAKPPDVVRAG